MSIEYVIKLRASYLEPKLYDSSRIFWVILSQETISQKFLGSWFCSRVGARTRWQYLISNPLPPPYVVRYFLWGISAIFASQFFFSFWSLIAANAQYKTTRVVTSPTIFFSSKGLSLGSLKPKLVKVTKFHFCRAKQVRERTE